MKVSNSIILVLLVCGAASAQVTLPIANAGFEAPAIPANSFSTTSPPPGWSVFGSGIDFNLRTIGVLNPTGTALYPTGAPEGSQVGVVFLLDDFADQTTFAGIEAGMEQTLTAPLMPHTSYLLRVEIGNIADDPAPPNTPFQFAGFPGYRVELTAGGMPLACDANTLMPAEGTFLTTSVSFVTGATHAMTGQPLGIRLVNLNAAPGLEVNFDDVRLTASAVGSGQANSAAASLMVDGEGTAGAAGPFLAQVNGAMTLDWVAQPFTPVLLAVGPLNPGNTVIPGIGSLDLGTPPGFADVLLLDSGVGPLTDATGLSTETIPLPPFLTGFFFAVQGFVRIAPPPFVALTAAFHVLPL